MSFTIKFPPLCKKLTKYILLSMTLLLGISTLYSQDTKPINIDSLEQLLRKKNNHIQPETLISLSIGQMEENPEIALRIADLAAQKAQAMGEDYLYSDALKLKADAWFYLDSLQASLETYLLSAEVDQATRKPRNDSILRRYGDAGYVLYIQGNFTKSNEYFQLALKMSIERNDTAEMATNYSNMGLNYNIMGDYAKSINCFMRTLQLDKITRNEANISTSYNSIGMVYFAWKKFEKAREYLELALSQDRKKGEESKISIRLGNLSRVYIALNRHQDAINSLEEALKIDRRLNNPSKVAIRLQGLGYAYRSISEPKKALTYYNEALKIYENLKMNFKIAGLMIQRGELYEDIRNFAQAEKDFLEGLRIARSLQMRPEELTAVQQLYHLKKVQKNYAGALMYHEQYKAIHDSLFSENSAKQINEFEVKYETEKKEKENLVLLEENENHQRTFRFSIAAIAILIVLSGTFFWAFSVKRKSLRQSKILFIKESELSRLKIDTIEKHNSHLQELLFAEEEIKRLQAVSIEQKNHELTSAAMLIANKNEIFEKLRSLAEQIKARFPDAKNTEVKAIIGEIDKQTDLEDQWDQFKIHFESIHTTFFENLRDKDARLTQNDMQLCAYIKLNLSTKEISRLLNIAPESVNTSRYRLKKKFNLDAQVTLDEFIMTL